MEGKLKIMCANKTHQGVIVHFLEQIQLYIDEITEDDDDFDIFMNVLRELIEKSNKDVIFSFLGGEHQDKWINQLPMTVYYAVIGYMYLIEVSLFNVMDTVEKINNLVRETLDELEFVIISDKKGESYYKICLN